MRGKNPCSTISYNTQEFLEYQLNNLMAQRIISNYVFIRHEAEADERKAHIHLLIIPNKLIDTMELQELLTEEDFDHPGKPLHCIDFRKSEIDDWILYCSHNPVYLASKLQSREFQYSYDCFVNPDDDNFFELWNHSLYWSDWAIQNKLLRTLVTCQDPAGLINAGVVPLNMASNVRSYYYLREHRFPVLDRNNTLGHNLDDLLMFDDPENIDPILTGDSVGFPLIN